MRSQFKNQPRIRRFSPSLVFCFCLFVFGTLTSPNWARPNDLSHQTTHFVREDSSFAISPEKYSPNSQEKTAHLPKLYRMVHSWSSALWIAEAQLPVVWESPHTLDSSLELSMRRRASQTNRAYNNRGTRQLEALEARQLLSSVVTGSLLKFAVQVPQRGLYTVDVYQSSQQFSPNSITGLSLGDPTKPVVVHAAGTTVDGADQNPVASWNVVLAPGRSILRVSSSYFATKMPAQAPAAATAVEAIAQSATRVGLHWADNSSNESGFTIQRQVNGSSIWSLLTTTSPNVTSYTDTTAQSGTQYSYRVVALNSVGDSTVSTAATATTPSLPAAPSLLSASVLTTTSIQLSWTDNADSETGFLIERQQSGSSTWTTVTTAAADATSFTDTGLQASTSYAYRVSAVNAAGTSAASNTATASTIIPVPAAPSALTATVNSINQITLTWTDNSNNETGFVVQRHAAGSSTWTVVATTAANVTTLPDNALQPGTSYYYRVLAVNAGGYSVESNTASNTTFTPPAAPGNLSLTVLSSTSIKLAWADNSTNETGFRIERQAAGSNTWGLVATTGSNATTFTDNGVQANTQYSYRIFAVNGASSAASNIATGSTLIVLPNAPTNLALTVQSCNAIGLSWSDNANNETGYKIERQAGDGTSNDGWTVVTTTAADATSYSDATVSPSTQYAYRISAVNAAGASDLSNMVSGTTPAANIITPGTLTPGNWPATPQPGVQGNPLAAGYTQAENAIARWDVVPYQTFTGNFNVGVVAFHSSGIDHVAFSVNGGPWTNVTEMTLNPQTANTSGVGVPTDGIVEYWATLRASDFATDGQVEVRAIAYPKLGVPVVLQGLISGATSVSGLHSMILNADGHGTLPSAVRYVSQAGSDITGDGTVGNPFATMSKAALDIQTAQGSVDGATIYLTAGDYVFGGIDYPWPTNTNQYLTITAAPGAESGQVRIVDSLGDGMRIRLVHVVGITLAPKTGSGCSIISNGMSQLGDGSCYAWVDKCAMMGDSQVTTSSWVSGFTNQYITDCEVTNSLNGVCGELVRNERISDIGEDAFDGIGLVANCSVIRTQGLSQAAIDANLHPDVVQFQGNTKNAIVYGLTTSFGAYGGFGQGIFSGRQPDGLGGVIGISLKDIAFVNCDVQLSLTSGGTVFGFEGPAQNMYILNSTFGGNSFWRTDFYFAAKDVYLQDNVFIWNGGQSVQPMSPASSPSGVTVK